MKSKARAAALKYGYRSGLELDTAKFLKSKGVTFTYEENKIRWEDFKVRTYTPDFYVTSKSGKEIIIETKGRFVATDRAKHLSIRKQFGDTYDIRFLFSNPNVKLSKASKTTYAMWCRQHGFMWDKGPAVPLEWLEE